MLTDAQKRAAYDQFGHAGVDALAWRRRRRLRSARCVRRHLRRRVRRHLRRRSARPLAGLPRRRPALRARARSRAGGVRRHRRTSSSRRSPSARTATAPARAQGTKPVTCETCRGAGQVRMQQGFFTVQQTCPRCQGRGQVISEPVRHLPRPGPRAQARRRSRSRFPAGVDNGDRIRLTGEGEAGRNGGPPGDLYVEIRVREHAIFERDGSHLSCEVPISFATATLGGTVEVPTLEGNASIKVPPETQSGRVFRLREKGVKPVRGGADRRSVLPRRRRDAGQSHARAEGAAAQVRGLAAGRCQAASPARGVVARRREALLHEPRASDRAAATSRCSARRAAWGGRIVPLIARGDRPAAHGRAGGAQRRRDRVRMPACWPVPRAAGVAITADPARALAGAQVAIDFTLPQAHDDPRAALRGARLRRW